MKNHLAATELERKLSRKLKKETSHPLTFILNGIMASAGFPDSFKIGTIKRLYKSGNENEMVYYIPITLISHIAKITEKN